MNFIHTLWSKQLPFIEQRLCLLMIFSLKSCFVQNQPLIWISWHSWIIMERFNSILEIFMMLGVVTYTRRKYWDGAEHIIRRSTRLNRSFIQKHTTNGFVSWAHITYRDDMGHINNFVLDKSFHFKRVAYPGGRCLRINHWI